MDALRCKHYSTHVIHAMPKGNLGTIAAQRALYKLLLDNNVDLSVSTPNPELFKQAHPESRSMKVYRSLTPMSSMAERHVSNYLLWIIITMLRLLVFTFIAPFIRIGIIPSSMKNVIERVKKCSILMDLNLELFRGIPISVARELIKQKPRVLVIHKLFWSFRIFQHLWFLVIIKGVFKKKLVIGPASFGPFDSLPVLIRWLTKAVLSKFVDLVLVREPYSAILLNKLGVKKYLIVADIALLIRTEEPRDSLAPPRLVVGVAPALLRCTLTREEVKRYIEAHAKCLDELATQYEIVFIPSTPEDAIMSKMIMARMKNNQRVKIIVTNNLDKYEFLIKNLKLLITTRMHPSIIAARNFIPFASVIYDHKQLGLLQQLGLRKFSLYINEISYDKLRLLVNGIIQNHDKIRETLQSTISKLRNDLSLKLFYSIHALIDDG